MGVISRILSVSLFTILAWGPMLVHTFFRSSRFPEPAEVTSFLSDLDKQVLEPQVRLLLFLSPPLAEKWPGPLSGAVTTNHRLLLLAVYGFLGWISVKGVFHLQDWWSSRVIWLIVAWVICFSLLQVPASIFTHFGILRAE